MSSIVVYYISFKRHFNIVNGGVGHSFGCVGLGWHMRIGKSVSAKLANQTLRLPVFKCAQLNTESQGNSWVRQARQRPKCLDLILWTLLGRSSRIKASVVPAGGAGVSDVGLVNGRWIVMDAVGIPRGGKGVESPSGNPIPFSFRVQWLFLIAAVSPYLSEPLMLPH